jgi:serine/threonine protein kinase/tetratricopeptide (TPR) repeat protein
MNGTGQTAKQIFVELIASVPAEQWDQRLVEACSGDHDLQRRVQALLRAHRNPDSFMKEPALPLDLDRTIDQPLERPGDMIGPYRLLEQIGEGGFGVVFMAQQKMPLCLKVALKVLKPGMDTRQVIARFEAERQALALMDHPNIAKVSDAGTTEAGRPYFVMELVRGIPITEYCDRDQLTARERLQLFLGVCRAVQHAHQKGIIHRDLKPSNVLVTLHDGTPVVKVIDFGIAKAVGQQLTEKTLFTNFAQMMGTPVYMSPEQAALSGLDIDTRSDIYSLGVLLYELLSGTTPFEKERLARADFDEMRRIIREEEPPPPSTRISTLGLAAGTIASRRHMPSRQLSRFVRGELDWVVMKCLSKDRTQRYESASALAADLERYLAGRPIEARPPSAAYRLRKYARRNRIVITTIGLVAAALLIGIAASTWQAYRATEAKQRAETNFQKARQAVDRYFTLVSQSELLDEPGLQLLRKDLLEAALGYYQEFLAERAGDRELKVELAAAYFRAGQVCHLIDRNDDAIVHLERSVRLVEELLADPKNSAALELHLAGLHQAGRTLHGGTRPPSDPQGALRTLKRAAKAWERLASEHPHAAGFRSDLAGFNVLTGDLQRSLGERNEAITSYERATQILETLVQDYPRVANYRADLASCHEVLGLLARLKGRIAESDQALQRSLVLREGLATEFRERPGLRMELASAYRELGTKVYADQPPLALENLNKALGVLRQLAADHPGIPAYEEQLARVQMSLAALHAQAGQMETAEEASREALSLLGRLAERFPASPHYCERLMEYYRELHPRLAAAGRAANAQRAYEQIIALQKSLADDFGDVARYHEQLAWTLVICPYEALRDEPRAVEAAKRGVELQPNSGNYWRTLGGAHYRAAAAEPGAADWQPAIDALEKSLQLAPGPKGANRLLLAMSHWRLATHGNAGAPLSAESQAEHWQQAQELFREAAKWIDKNDPAGDITGRLRAEAAALLEIETANN